MRNTFCLFFRKKHVAEVELRETKVISAQEEIQNWREQFRMQLSHALTVYTKRWFSSISSSSAAMVGKLEKRLNSQFFDPAEVLVLITQFMSVKNLMLNSGRLFDTLFHVWKKGMYLLCFDYESFERFLEISDKAKFSLLHTCVWTEWTKDEHVIKTKVGEYLLKLSEASQQDYIQYCLINRGFYPAHSSCLPARFVSIRSFEHRDSLDGYRSSEVSSHVSCSSF